MYEAEQRLRTLIDNMPDLVLFKDGKAVAKSVGYRPKSAIAAMVEGAR